VNTERCDQCTNREDIVEIRKDVKKILQRVSVVEVKSTVWGVFGGALVAMGLYITKGL